jgi:hypothetical protein
VYTWRSTQGRTPSRDYIPFDGRLFDRMRGDCIPRPSDLISHTANLGILRERLVESLMRERNSATISRVRRCDQTVSFLFSLPAASSARCRSRSPARVERGSQRPVDPPRRIAARRGRAVGPHDACTDEGGKERRGGRRPFQHEPMRHRFRCTQTRAGPGPSRAEPVASIRPLGTVHSDPAQSHRTGTASRGSIRQGRTLYSGREAPGTDLDPRGAFPEPGMR